MCVFKADSPKEHHLFYECVFLDAAPTAVVPTGRARLSKLDRPNV